MKETGIVTCSQCGREFVLYTEGVRGFTYNNALYYRVCYECKDSIILNGPSKNSEDDKQKKGGYYKFINLVKRVLSAVHIIRE